MTGSALSGEFLSWRIYDAAGTSWSEDIWNLILWDEIIDFLNVSLIERIDCLSCWKY
jgi:hypothetical protein